MTKKKAEKRKAKRKAKQKSSRLIKEKARVSSSRIMKSEFYAEEARFYWNSGDYVKALHSIQIALKADPQNKTYLQRLVDVGQKLDRNDLVLLGCNRLYHLGKLDDADASFFVNALIVDRNYHKALQILELYLAKLPESKIANKRKIKSYLIDCRRICQAYLEHEKNKKHVSEKQQIPQSFVAKKDQKQTCAEKFFLKSRPAEPIPLQQGLKLANNSSITVDTTARRADSTTTRIETKNGTGVGSGYWVPQSRFHYNKD